MTKFQLRRRQLLTVARENVTVNATLVAEAGPKGERNTNETATDRNPCPFTG
jgi:hypothetical protein